MTKVNIYAGFDVSKKCLDVCLLHKGTEVVKQFVYDTHGLAALAGWLPQGCHCVMEATGPYYLRVALELHSQGFYVSVVNPLVIRRFSQMRMRRTKTDQADARIIAAYALCEQPPVWQPPKAWAVKLQQLDTLLRQMQKQHTALLCQREAFTTTTLMDEEIREFLDQAIAHLKEQLHHLDKSIQALIREYQGQMLQNIVTIPGVGKKTAAVLIGITGGFSRFNNYRQLSAYLGLCPRIYQSGSSVKGKSRICKMGMSRVRAMLYVCAWSAKRCNKACRELYERLVAKGKSKRLALIAVANKLLKQAFAIATHNTKYQPGY
jgi:transposase